MDAAAITLKRSSMQTQREVLAWTTRLVRGVQRLRQRSATEVTLNERSNKILNFSAPFDPFYYWRSMVPMEEPVYVTTSRVKEIIAFRCAAYVICSGGEMIKLDVSEDGRRVFVVWETRLVVGAIDDPATSPVEPTHLSSYLCTGVRQSNTSVSSLSSTITTPPVAPTKSPQYEAACVNHAAFNTMSRVFYFTVRNDGIFYARLANIESGIESARRDYTLLKPLVTRLTHPNLISFNGLAVDANKCLLFCCCEEMITVWSTYPHQPALVLQFEMPLYMPANISLHTRPIPYKCAILPDPKCNARACLIVADKRNSELVKISLQYYTPVLPGPAMSVAVVRSQSLAIGGNRIGCVQHPQGISFDSAGNLMVADNGNQRIQFFARPDELFLRQQHRLLEDDDDNSLAADETIHIRLGIFEQLKTVTPMRTGPFQQGQMIVLAGLGKSFGNTSGGKIICVRCPQHHQLGQHSATLPAAVELTELE